MIECLFRGKRIDNGEWAYGVPVDTEAESGIKMFIIAHAKWDSDDNTIDFLETNVYEVDPGTVGQYTGLTDKKGKRTFEGDIIQNIDEDDDMFIETYVIVWDNKNASWGLELNDEILFYLNEMMFGDKVNGEVIGNIHDNSELVEEYYYDP